MKIQKYDNNSGKHGTNFTHALNFTLGLTSDDVSTLKMYLSTSTKYSSNNVL